MPTPVIKIKRNIAGNAPTSLGYGELAADIVNQKLYIGDSSSNPILIGDGAFAGGGIAQLAFRVQQANGASNVFQITPTEYQSDQVLDFYLDIKSQTSNYFFAAPIASNGYPSFRRIMPADFASGSANGKYLTSDGTTFTWSTPATGTGGNPSGANGQIQLVVKDGGVFDSLTNFQILTNSSEFSKSNIITVPTQNATYSKINFPFNNIFSENDIVGISIGGGATTNYVIRNITNTSFKTYALPTSSGSSIGSLQTFSSSNISPIQLFPSSNSSTPVFFTGSLSTTKDSDNPSTITVASGIISNFRVGMQITSGVRPVIIRGIIVDTTQTGSQTYSFAETLSTTTYPVGCYVDVLRSGRSLDSNSNASTYAYSGLLNTDNAYISARANTSITLNTYITGTFNTDDTSASNPTKKTDTTIVVDLVVYPRGSIRPNTFITHIDASTNTLTLNQPQFRGGNTGTTSVTITGYAAHPERRVFSFGTPLYNTSSEILTNESISLVKQLNDAGRNLEQKILFKSPEAYTIAVTSWSTATATLSTKNNLLEMSVGDIVLYGTSSSGTTHNTPSALTFISEIDYNLGRITLNAVNGLPSSTTQLTIRSCKHVKSVIEHRAFPFDNYNSTYRFTSSNITKYAHGLNTNQGYLDYATSNNSYERNIWDGQKGSGNNLGSINDMGLYICSDTSIKIGMSSLARGANTDNKSIKEPVDTLTSHITIEPTRVSSNEVYNGIYVKNLTVTNKNDFDNSNYLYLLGCRSSTPRKNDGYNYLTWYRIATTSISTLVGGAGTTINPKENIGEFGIEPQLEISLADEVPINTSLTVPLIKGTAGGDLNITTSNPDTDIILAIPPNNTDIVLSTGSIYITSGLDGGDIYVQSAEDVYLTSQNVRVSGNLIVDGYIQSATGFQGDNTDAEEPITGLVMDGGTF